MIGRSAYFGVPELGRDALKAAHAVLAALWAHSDAVTARAEHPLVGRGFLLVTGIEGGGFIAVPERCRLSLIRKLLPGESLDAAAQELEAAVRGAVTDPEIRVEIAYPAGRDHRARRHADRDRPDRSRRCASSPPRRPGRCPGGAGSKARPSGRRCRSSPALGVPAVYCAPGDIRNCHTFEEHVELDEYFAGVLAYARFIARYCGVAEQPMTTGRRTMRRNLIGCALAGAGAGRAGLDADRRTGRRERHALVGDHALRRRPRRR